MENLTQEQIKAEIELGKKINKLEELENWFDNYFEKQFIQSMWQENFTISKDPFFKDENGLALTYETIDDLKAKGEEVRIRIKELRELLSQMKHN